MVQNVAAPERRKRVTELLEAVGMIEHSRKRPDQLSGNRRMSTKRQSKSADRIKADPAGCDLTSVDRSPCCTIMESISDGVFTIDSNKRITSFNRAAESITGFNREGAIGQ
ncbi:MAG: PAS domain-containing protein [Desulfobacterales bacterium]